MDNIEFIKRLKMVIKLRQKITRNELLTLLNTFWQHNKSLLRIEYQYYCYSILKSIIQKFDAVIEGSNRQYYYCYSTKVLEFIK